MLSSRSRSNVAVQACQTCRKRKSKCDELRPKCTLCQRLNLECKYEETSPTKKDETMVHILGSLQRLEAKFDGISLQMENSQSPIFPSSRASSSRRTTASDPVSERPEIPAEHPQIGSKNLGSAHPYFTAPHRIIVWPTIYSQLADYVPQASSDLTALLESGTPWLVRMDINRYSKQLPFDVGLPSQALETGFAQSLFASRIIFPTLTDDLINLYSDAYFNTFNVLYPILDYELFTSETLPPILSNGFSYGDAASVLTLLVLSLGQLASDSLRGEPIGNIDGQPSGICGGSAFRPPGLELFNEARARIGSIRVRCDLMNVQILVLQATYFEANGCHVEYWRSTVTACMSCLVLAQYPGVAWLTLQGDLIKRAFWTCMIDEDFYHLDLDLPRTTIREFADKVQLPHFHDTKVGRKLEGSGEDQSLLQYHFLAKIGLQRIIARIYDAIDYYSSQFESLDDYGGPPMHVIREMSHQLASWRAWLPRNLQWSDEDLLNHSGEDTSNPSDKWFNAGAPAASRRDPRWVSTGVNLLTVELRARFFYARFILCRPFIFKALHFSSLMNAQDAEYCAGAIRDACMLPLALSPSRQHKRLIPHLFTWTQNFIAILLILWISQRNTCLGQICSEKLDDGFLGRSITHMVHWIRDVKHIDGIADWAWKILEPLLSELPWTPSS